MTVLAMATELGQQGVCVWDGDFYALRPIELLGLAARGGVLRTGVSMYSQESDIERLLSGLSRIAGRRMGTAA